MPSAAPGCASAAPAGICYGHRGPSASDTARRRLAHGAAGGGSGSCDARWMIRVRNGDVSGVARWSRWWRVARRRRPRRRRVVLNVRRSACVFRGKIHGTEREAAAVAEAGVQAYPLPSAGVCSVREHHRACSICADGVEEGQPRERRGEADRKRNTRQTHPSSRTRRPGGATLATPMSGE